MYVIIFVIISSALKLTENPVILPSLFCECFCKSNWQIPFLKTVHTSIFLARNYFFACSIFKVIGFSVITLILFLKNKKNADNEVWMVLKQITSILILDFINDSLLRKLIFIFFIIINYTSFLSQTATISYSPNFIQYK